MSAPYDQSTRIIQQRSENERWAMLTLSGWHMGRWAIALYVVAAIILPAAVALLIWSFSS